MAVILVMDRVREDGKKRPRIRKIVCDGYMLYSQRQTDEQTGTGEMRCAGAVSALGIARTMMGNGIGESVYHELREEIARIAAQERAQKLAQRRAQEKQEGGGCNGRAD